MLAAGTGKGVVRVFYCPIYSFSFYISLEDAPI